jgi:hypothetical protein
LAFTVVVNIGTIGVTVGTGVGVFVGGGDRVGNGVAVGGPCVAVITMIFRVGCGNQLG